jgi:hypothetical protein
MDTGGQGIFALQTTVRGATIKAEAIAVLGPF